MVFLHHQYCYNGVKLHVFRTLFSSYSKAIMLMWLVMGAIVAGAAALAHRRRAMVLGPEKLREIEEGIADGHACVFLFFFAPPMAPPFFNSRLFPAPSLRAVTRPSLTRLPPLFSNKKRGH
jgi:hypothetical protein